jgi:exonuclease SbcC
MHITEVHLENIKSHVNSVFRFGRGTTAITGENGAGKTTILEAVAWALFDVLDYKKDDFVRRGAKKGSVRVTFESDLDQREYTVYRDTAGAYYLQDPGINTRLAEKKTDVGALLRQRLGVEPGTDLEDLFRHAIGVPQGTFTAAFLDRPAARKVAFDRLLKVEEYRDSAELLLDTVRLIAEKTRAVRERIAFAEGKLEAYDQIAAEQKQLLAAARDLAATITRLDQRLVAQVAATSSWENALRALEIAKNLTERLAVEYAGAGRRLGERQTEHDRAAEALARREASAGAHQSYLAAIDQLKELERERITRDQWLRESSELEKRVALKSQEVQRLEEAIAVANHAGIEAETLAPALAEQVALELERERLRTERADAASAQTAIRQLDVEHERLRAEYAEIRDRIRLAETGEVAEERVIKLRDLRRQSEAALSRLQTFETSHTHLSKQRVGLAEEVARLRGAVTEHEQTVAAGSQLATQAALAEPLQIRETELTEILARLRANQARDEKMQSEVRNGLCPILSQKCLNLSEGETLDDYFRDQFASNTERLERLEKEREELSQQVKSAREATTNLVRWESVRQQLESERQTLTERDAAIKSIDRDLQAMPSRIPELISDERRNIAAIEVQEIKADQEARLFAELKPLRSQLEQVGARGARLNETRAELSAVADRVPEFDKAIADNEQKLSELADPRARISALNTQAARAETLLCEKSVATEAWQVIETEWRQLQERSAQFTGLDDALAQNGATRDATVGAYREYLASEELAATVPQRKAELAEAFAEAERLTGEVEQAETALAQMGSAYDPERHAADRAALAETRDELAGARALIIPREERLGALQQELDRLSSLRDSLRNELAEHETLTRLAETTEFIRDTLKQAGPLVARSYLYNISLEANLLFREITGEAGRSLRWAEDYEVMLEEAGHERPFVNLSGGEQMAAALAVRLALLKQLSDIRIAFFDEPTANLDAERRERLAQQISQVQHFDQLFIISHDDTFEDSVDHVVHVRRPAETQGATGDGQLMLA